MGLTAAVADRNFRIAIEALCREARGHGPTCQLAVSPLTAIPPPFSLTDSIGTTELILDYAFVGMDDRAVHDGWLTYGPWPEQAP